VKAQQDASKVTCETSVNQNRTNKQFKASHTFHQTLSVHDWETTPNALWAIGKLEFSIRRLKNKTGYDNSCKTRTRAARQILDSKIEIHCGTTDWVWELELDTVHPVGTSNQVGEHTHFEWIDSREILTRYLMKQEHKNEIETRARNSTRRALTWDLNMNSMLGL
jgi:hypothetical protein